MIRFFRELRPGLWHYLVPSVLVMALLGIIGLMGALVSRYLSAERHYRSAQSALERRDFAEARTHLAEYLKVWPSSAEAHFLAARTARRALAYDEAEQHLKECQRLGGVPEAIDLEWALMRVQRGEMTQLEGNLLYFVKEDHPDSKLILEALTRGYIQSYQLPRALYCLQLWLERQPDDIQALLWRAEVRERWGHHQQEALDDYRRVVELDPDRDDARLELAGGLLGKDAQQALPHFEHLLERQPENPAVLVGLARCRRLLGQREEALELLERVLRASPKDIEAMRERGMLAREMGQWDDAEHWFGQVVALAPYDHDATYLYALCLHQRGKTAEAKKYQDKLTEIKAQLARLKEVTAKIAETPHDPALRHEAGVIFLKSGQTLQGLRWLNSVLLEDPHYQPTHLALAVYYKSTGDHARAAQHRLWALQTPTELRGAAPPR